MKNNEKILAIIPARRGSKGILFKNIASLNGKPLIAYTIQAAQKSGIFDRIIVSTDCSKIKKVSKKYKATVIERPKNISKNITPTEPVISHILKWLKRKENYQPDVVVLLQPTSPLRTEADIKGAYGKLKNEKLDSLLSVSRNHAFIWKKEKNSFRPINYDYRDRPRRQDMNDQFKENGAIYVTKYSIFIKYRNRLGGKVGYYLMDNDRSIEIDSPLDLLIAERILRR